MSQFRNALLYNSLGLESAVAAEPTDENVVVADMPAHDPVAEAVDEVENSHDDVVEIEVVTDDVTQVAEGLESILVGMESTLASGGMNAQSAAFAQMAIQGVGGRVGITGRTIPSVESFGGKTGQLQQTRIACEGLKEKIQEVWKYVKEAVQKMIAKIKDFYLKTFDAAARLKKSAASVYAKADQSSGTLKDDNAKVTVSASMVKRLHVGGQLGNVDQAVGELANLTKKALEDANGKAVKFAEDFAAALGKIDLATDDPLTPFANMKVEESYFGGTDVSSSERFKDLKETKVTSTSELPGGKAIIHSMPTAATPTNGDIVASLSKGKYEVADFADKAPDIKEVEETPLSVAQIRKIAQEVESIASQIETFKRKSEDASKAIDKVKEAGEKLAKDMAKEDDMPSTKSSALTRAINAVPAVSGAVNQPAQRAISYIVPTAKEALSYAEKHLAQYK